MKNALILLLVLLPMPSYAAKIGIRIDEMKGRTITFPLNDKPQSFDIAVKGVSCSVTGRPKTKGALVNCVFPNGVTVNHGITCVVEKTNPLRDAQWRIEDKEKSVLIYLSCDDSSVDAMVTAAPPSDQ